MKYRMTNRPRIKIKPRRPVVLRSTLKKERDYKFQSIMKYVLVILLAGVISWAGYNGFDYLVNGSGYFEISKIDIRGFKNVTETEIRAVLPFRTGDNMLKFWSSVAENSIENSKPELKNVRVSRRPHRVVITLEEREPVAYTVIDGQRLGLDKDNRPFPLRGKWVRIAQETLPEVVCGGVVERKQIVDFIGMLCWDAKDLFSKIIRFRTETANSIVMELKDGMKVYWGEPERSDIKGKLEKLERVLEDCRKKYKALEYINLYYYNDGRILVKPVK